MAVIYLCPADKRSQCLWEGQASEIKNHFENVHRSLLYHTNSIQIDLDALPENKLLCLEGELYLMQNYVKRDKLVLKLRYLGSNETAAKMQYDIVVTVNQISYRYNSGRHFNCVVPKAEQWEINLESLERFHGNLEALICTVLLDNGDFNIGRKSSNTSLRINNIYIEKNVCDETEANYLDALSLINFKLDKLNQEKRESCDLMDKISQLDFSILEESFNKTSPTSQDHNEKTWSISEERGEEMSISEEHNETTLPLSTENRNEDLPFSAENRNEDLEKLVPNIPEEVNLSCSSCRLDMLPPIYLCTNGHNVCSWCKSLPCKICNSTITPNRNIDLENISRTHLHQCRYSSEGCFEKMLYNEVRAHEARCRFCKYKCQMSECIYEGKYGVFLNHLKIVHGSVKVGFSFKNDFPKNCEMYVVDKAIGIFYCQSSHTNEVVVWRATFCGPRERQFFCEISFKGNKCKEVLHLKRKGIVYEISKPVAELKKMKAKEKYAVLTINSYDR